MTIPAKRGTVIYKEKQEKQTTCLGVYVTNILIKYVGGISEEVESFRNGHKKSELFSSLKASISNVFAAFLHQMTDKSLKRG